MKRYIANMTSPNAEVYNVSNEYIIKCGQNSNSNSNLLIQYLEKAKLVAIFLDTGKSIFDNQIIANSETLASDGNWIWSADLNHYTKYHSFQWPESFLEHVKKKKFSLDKWTAKREFEIDQFICDIDLKIYLRNYNFGENSKAFSTKFDVKYNVVEL